MTKRNENERMQRRAAHRRGISILLHRRWEEGMVSVPAGRPTRQPKSHSSVRPLGGSKLQDVQSMVKPTSCAAWVLERERETERRSDTYG